MAAAPKYVFVKTTSPRGYFGRAGLRFTREWRPLKLAAEADLENGIIDAAVLARLEAETEMLAVRPATAVEEAELDAAATVGGGGKTDAERIAELEATVLKLQLGGSGGGKKQPEKQPEK